MMLKINLPIRNNLDLEWNEVEKTDILIIFNNITIFIVEKNFQKHAKNISYWLQTFEM